MNCKYLLSRITLTQSNSVVFNGVEIDGDTEGDTCLLNISKTIKKRNREKRKREEKKKTLEKKEIERESIPISSVRA